MSAKKKEASTEKAIEYGYSSYSSRKAEHTERESRLTQTAQEHEYGLPELCMCFPLSTRRLTPQVASDERDKPNDELLVPTTPQLNYLLRTQLKELLPRTMPLSILLLHVSQLEHSTLDSSMEPVQQRRRYHVTQNVLLQILNYMQRAIRHQDKLLLEEGVGVAMLFPAVDKHGIENIIERVYRSVCLLQAETIVPPLLHITDIVLGCGTYTPQDSGEQETEQVIEELLASTGRVARRLILRPALATSLWETMPHGELPITPSSPNLNEDQEAFSTTPINTWENVPQEFQEPHTHTSPVTRKQPARKKESVVITDAHATLPSPQSISSIPFLHLPTKLSPRLKHLIPYSVAKQLQCAPVGRDHHTLTVAMADPADNQAIQRLKEVTGMTIFPVSCENEALLALLREKW